MKNNNQHITIIGAGLSGLYCGSLLQELGYHVTILEARDRVGGRTYTENGIDLGGSWVSSLHPRIIKLCKQFNLSLSRQFEEGTFVHYFNQKRSELNEKHNILKPQTTNTLTPFIERFHQMADSDDFFETQQHFDQVSFADWCQNNIADEMAISTLYYSFRLLTCVEPQCASLFFWLYFLKSCGGLQALVSIKGGAQEFRIHGGAQTLSHQLAKNLQIIYQADVMRVEKQDGRYHIHTQDKKTYWADKVISAIPAQLIPHIHWEPCLESQRIAFYQSLKMGSVTKVVVEYETAFWRLDGYNAQIVSDTPPVYLAYDVCDEKHHAIVVFIVNDKGYSDQQIVDQLAFLLCNDLAKKPSAIYRKNWTEDPFSGGCYFCVPPVNSLAMNHHYLITPYNNLYFIGTETANEWMGYMEGALESAERVVAQIKASNFK